MNWVSERKTMCTRKACPMEATNVSTALAIPYENATVPQLDIIPAI